MKSDKAKEKRIKLKSNGTEIGIDESLPIKKLIESIPEDCRAIVVKCKAQDYISLADVKEFQGDLKTLPEKNKKKLIISILTQGWTTPLFLWQDGQGNNFLLDGHSRILVSDLLQKAGFIIPDLPVIFIEADSEKEAAEILLSINNQYNIMTQQGFEDYVARFDLDFSFVQDLEIPDIDIDIEFFKDAIEANEQTDISQVELSELEIEKEIMQQDNFYFSFSGGRDSTLAMAKVLPKLQQAGKKAEALFVDTGVEFPDLLPYINRITSEMGIPLRVLHAKRNFFDVYVNRGVWPDSIHRDCIEILISGALDKYCDEKKEKYVLIRGGRSKQKTRTGNSNIIQRLDSKPLMTIYNPLQRMDQQTYDAEIQSIPIWPGYAKGFDRTACWCCPFQTAKQWDALKANYPLLWDEMRSLVLSLHFKKHKGDGYPKRIKDYWGTIK